MFFFIRRNTFHYDDLVQYIELHKPDVVMIRLDSNFMQVRRLTHRFPSLVVATEVNASPFDEAFKNIAFVNFFRRLERNNLRYSINFFVSDFLRRRIMGDVFDLDSNVVVHNGVDFTKFYPLAVNDNQSSILKKSQTDFVIGYIGTLDVHKQVDILLRAFGKVCLTYRDARLMIVGDGPDRTNLERLADELGIQQNVVFTGWVKHDEVPQYIRSFNLAVHHHAEKYMSPLKLFEYLACGVGVIGPKTPSVEEVFTDNREMLLTDGTVGDLSSKILLLIEEPGRLAGLAQHGKELVESSYSWAHNADVIVTKLVATLKSRRN